MFSFVLVVLVVGSFAMEQPWKGKPIKSFTVEDIARILGVKHIFGTSNQIIVQLKFTQSNDIPRSKFNTFF